MKSIENLRIQVKPELPKSGSWKSVLDKVDELLDKEYSHVYCLIDYDKVIEENAFEKYENRKKSLLKTKKVTIYECNPCFETWYLVHFRKTTKPFSNCDNVANELKLHITDYGKSEIYYDQKKIYQFLKNYQADASINAASLEENRHEFGINHPRAEVYKLVTTQVVV